jgi:hypothetical protein
MSYPKVVRVIDPRIDVSQRPAPIVAQEGPADITYQVIPAADQSNTSNVTFAVNPPSPNSGVNRFMRVHATGTITVVGANLNNPLVQLALRDWPLHQIMSNLQVQINNATITASTPQAVIQAFSRVSNPAANGQGLQSSTSTAPDVTTSYADVTNTACSPFNSGIDVAQGDAIWRTRTSQITDIACSGPQNGLYTLMVSFDISEPLILSPFVVGNDLKKSIFGVSQMIVSMSYMNLHKMLSLAIPPNVAATIVTVGVAFTRQELEVSFVSPSSFSVGQETADNEYVYNAATYQLLSSQQSATIAPGAISQAVTQSFNLAVVPRMLILWVTRSSNDILTSPLAAALPDTFLPIQSISVQYGQKSGLLAGASPRQLYEISYRAGLQATYNQFAGTSIIQPTAVPAGTMTSVPAAVYGGAPIVLDLTELSLPENVAPGMLVNTQVQVTLTFRNNNIATLTTPNATAVTNPQIQLLAITDQLLSIKGGNATISTGDVTYSDIKKARELSALSQAAFDAARMENGVLGGSFLSFLKDVGRGALHVLPQVAKIGIPLATKLLSGAGGATMPANSIRARLARGC